MSIQNTRNKRNDAKRAQSEEVESQGEEKRGKVSQKATKKEIQNRNQIWQASLCDRAKARASFYLKHKPLLPGFKRAFAKICVA